MGYKLGIDFSHKTEEDLQYLVFPPALDYTSGSYALQGKYFGTKVSAEAAVVMGAQLLLGGFNKSFTLQPPGACPRISLLFKIKAFSKNTHSHIGNISESRTSLTGALFFGNNAEFGQNGILGQAPSTPQGGISTMVIDLTT
jgi:hypothetical protein